MEKLKKNRSVVRATVTKLLKCMENEQDEQEIETNYMILEKKFNLLEDLDKQIYDLMLEEDVEESDLLTEVETAEDYTHKFYRAKIIWERRVKAKNNDTESTGTEGRLKSNESSNSKRKLKLPKLELPKFGGNIKDWLNFWSMFQKIDTDPKIANEDKFQYLIQSTVPGSRARQLVDSFPPTAANYTKAVDSLKSRFGREDLLIKMYVRELLGLIVQNLNSQTKLSLETLYDKIESQLRALESLNVTLVKYSAILYPLIESCLPEYLLRIWQRSGTCDRDDNLKSQLDNLLLFLKKEVENEERVNMAVTNFGMSSGLKSSYNDQSRHSYVKDKPKLSTHEGSVPTAHDLVRFHEKNVESPCVFCGKEYHRSENCQSAKGLSLTERQRLLKSKNVCFSCLKVGHHYNRCRSNVKCHSCGQNHVTLMCYKDQQKGKVDLKSKIIDTNLKSSDVESSSPSVENTLSNNSSVDVSLQIVVVTLRGVNHTRKVRALFDSGSQLSYILESTAQDQRRI